MWNYALIRYSLLGYAITSCIWYDGTRHFLFLALIGAVISVIRDKKIPHFTEPALLKAIAVFLGALFLSAFFTSDLLFSLDKAWEHAKFMLPMLLVILFVREKETLTKFLWALLISLFAADCMAIWQGIHGDYRAPSFTSHYMIFAGYLVQLFSVLLLMLTKQGRNFIQCKSAVWLLAGFTLAALFFNGTRGVWVALAFISTVFSFFYTSNKKRWLSGFLLALLVLGMIFAGVPHFHDRVLTITDHSYESNTERLLLWHSAWQMFLDHPLTGIGVGNFPIEYPAHYISPKAVEPNLGHAHNDFLHMLAETGLLGFTSFLYLFFVIIYYSGKNYQCSRSSYSLLAVLVTAGFLLQGITEYNFGNPPVIRLYWFLIGIGFSAAGYQGQLGRSDKSGAKY